MTLSVKTQKIKGFFDDLLSLILPKDADTAEIESMSLEVLSEKIPRSHELEENTHKTLFQYKNKIARKAIWEIKYKGNPKIAGKFSTLFYEYILETISDETIFSNFTDPLLVPIPASKLSLKERGFNQCELIAKEIKKIDNKKNFEICLSVLLKIKETLHQSKLKNRSKRFKNLQGCFRADHEKIKGRNVILIDDVITTGATMKEASKTLRKAGAKKVICFGIAH